MHKLEPLGRICTQAEGWHYHGQHRDQDNSLQFVVTAGKLVKNPELVETRDADAHVFHFKTRTPCCSWVRPKSTLIRARHLLSLEAYVRGISICKRKSVELVMSLQATKRPSVEFETIYTRIPASKHQLSISCTPRYFVRPLFRIINLLPAGSYV